MWWQYFIPIDIQIVGVWFWVLNHPYKLLLNQSLERAQWVHLHALHCPHYGPSLLWAEQKWWLILVQVFKSPVRHMFPFWKEPGQKSDERLARCYVISPGWWCDMRHLCCSPRNAYDSLNFGSIIKVWDLWVSCKDWRKYESPLHPSRENIRSCTSQWAAISLAAVWPPIHSQLLFSPFSNTNHLHNKFLIKCCFTQLLDISRRCSVQRLLRCMGYWL